MYKYFTRNYTEHTKPEMDFSKIYLPNMSSYIREYMTVRGNTRNNSLFFSPNLHTWVFPTVVAALCLTFTPLQAFVKFNVNNKYRLLDDGRLFPSV